LVFTRFWKRILKTGTEKRKPQRRATIDYAIMFPGKKNHMKKEHPPARREVPGTAARRMNTL